MSWSIALTALIITSAAFMLTRVARLYTQYRDGTLLSYFLYLLSWYGFVLFMAVFFFSPDLLPRQTHYGYLLFSSIFIIPLHGAISWFFGDLSLRLVRVTISWVCKTIIMVPFAVILVLYSVEVFHKLSVENVPENFSLESPISLYFMLLILLASLILLRIGAGRTGGKTGRAMLGFVYSMVTGMLIGVSLGLNIIDIFGFRLQNNLSIAVFAMLNLPGLFFIQKIVMTRVSEEASRYESTEKSIFTAKYGITPRELEVISLVIAGKSNREIEEKLFISPETVKKHIYNIYRKVGVNNRVQLVNTVFGRSNEDDDLN